MWKPSVSWPTKQAAYTARTMEQSWAPPCRPMAVVCVSLFSRRSVPAVGDGVRYPLLLLLDKPKLPRSLRYRSNSSVGIVRARSETTLVDATCLSVWELSSFVCRRCCVPRPFRLLFARVTQERRRGEGAGVRRPPLAFFSCSYLQ